MSPETNANNTNAAAQQAATTRAAFGSGAGQPAGVGRAPQRGGTPSFAQPSTSQRWAQPVQNDDVPDDAGFDVDLPAEAEAGAGAGSGRKDSLDFPDFLK